MLSIINAAAEYLAANGVGAMQQTIFVGRPNAFAATSVTVVQTGGVLSWPSSKAFKTVTFMVLVVDSSYATGSAKAEQVYDLLHDKFNIFTGYAGRCLATHLPGPNSRNENDKVVFELSFQFDTVF